MTLVTFSHLYFILWNQTIIINTISICFKTLHTFRGYESVHGYQRPRAWPQQYIWNSSNNWSACTCVLQGTDQFLMPWSPSRQTPHQAFLEAPLTSRWIFLRLYEYPIPNQRRLDYWNILLFCATIRSKCSDYKTSRTQQTGLPPICTHHTGAAISQLYCTIPCSSKSSASHTRVLILLHQITFPRCSLSINVQDLTDQELFIPW